MRADSSFPAGPTLLLLAVCCLQQLCSGVAAAQDESEIERAREAFIKGARAAESGKWHEAERFFREAYEISGRESSLYNWALSLKELERNREAAEQLDNLLRNHNPDEEMRVQARKTLEALKAILAVISIDNLEPDVAYVIHVGEREIFDGGERPLEVFAEPGDLHVSVQAAGDPEAFVWERHVTRGSRVEVEFMQASVLEDQNDMDDDSGLFSSPIFWIVAGAVVAVGLGTYLVVDANADLRPESGNVLRLP